MEAEAIEIPPPEQSLRLALLYRRHASWLKAMLRRSGRHDAEDIVQEAFLRLSHYPSETVMHHPQALLLKVAQNVIRNAARSAHAAKNLAPGSGTASMSRSTAEPDQFESVLLKETILALPEAYRDVFLLSRFGGMSNDQIAQTCNLTVKAVEWRLSKALALCAVRMRD